MTANDRESRSTSFLLVERRCKVGLESEGQGHSLLWPSALSLCILKGLYNSFKVAMRNMKTSVVLS